MAVAREQFLQSLNALMDHLNAGGIQDTALPGTATAEAMRLVKNGVSVSSFTCFEHFYRGRTKELLDILTSDPSRPSFPDLPNRLQMAATRGVIEALRFYFNRTDGSLDVTDIVSIAQAHAATIASSSQTNYSISEMAFGHAGSNIGAGSLKDFLTACDGAPYFDQIADVLTAIKFDYVAAGLASSGALKLSGFALWRHDAAHDATFNVDVALLATRISAYVAIAAAFDFLASLAISNLLTPSPSPTRRDWRSVSRYELVPANPDFELLDSNGTSAGSFYSVSHCKSTLGESTLPYTKFIVVRGIADRISDWFFI